MGEDGRPDFELERRLSGLGAFGASNLITFKESPLGARSVTVPDARRLYVADLSIVDGNETLYRLDPDTGAILWSYDIYLEHPGYQAYSGAGETEKAHMAVISDGSVIMVMRNIGTDVAWFLWVGDDGVLKNFWLANINIASQSEFRIGHMPMENTGGTDALWLTDRAFRVNPSNNDWDFIKGARFQERWTGLDTTDASGNTMCLLTRFSDTFYRVTATGGGSVVNVVNSIDITFTSGGSPYGGDIFDFWVDDGVAKILARGLTHNATGPDYEQLRIFSWDVDETADQVFEVKEFGGSTVEEIFSAGQKTCPVETDGWFCVLDDGTRGFNDVPDDSLPNENDAASPYRAICATEILLGEGAGIAYGESNATFDSSIKSRVRSIRNNGTVNWSTDLLGNFVTGIVFRTAEFAS